MSDIALPPNFHFIPGNKFFAVSRDGQVFNLKTGRAAAIHKTNGYCFVNVNDEGKTRNFYVHRLVAMAFIPVPLEVLEQTDDPEINHKDGNKENNAVSNLEWVTSKQNILHSIETDLAEFQKVLGRNIVDNSIREHKSRHHVAREYNICVKRLKRHLESDLAGTWSVGDWVFKYDDGKPWLEIPDDCNIPNRWNRCYGIWVGEINDKKYMAARLEDLCIAMDLKYYTVQPLVRADGNEYRAMKHTFRYHALPTAAMLDQVEYVSKAKFRPIRKVKVTTLVNGNEFSTIFDSVRQCSKKLGIAITTLLYALAKSKKCGEYIVNYVD